MSHRSRTGATRALTGGGTAPRLRAAVAAAAAAVLLGACAGGPSDGASGASGPGDGAAATAPAASGSTGAVALSTAAGPLGTYLTDGAGRAVYMFASDTTSTSTCTGSCAVVWPPLPAPAAPNAAGGASTAQIGAITRPDGARQLTYAGHPLYYYQADTAAGDTKGEGSDGFGAKWWVLGPDGSPITDSTPTGGGYGY